MNKQSGLGLICGVLAAFAMLAISPPASAESSNVVSIEPVTAPPNSVTTVPIVIERATGIASISVNLMYDPDVANVTGAAQRDFTRFFAFDDTNAENGWVTMNTYIIGQDLTGDVKVADVTLKAVGDYGDSSTLNFSSLSKSDQYGTDVSGTLNNGMFIIPANVSVKTGTGTASFTLDSGLLSSIRSVAEAALPQEVLDNKPEGFALPHGIFSFAITGLTPGESVTVTITLPAPVPVGTHWWKVNTTAGNNTWYSLRIGDDDGDDVITITLTDGGAGDHDGVVNGVILDPGGPGWAPVHNRETGLNYTTIQAAIDDANTTDGHTITVDPGIYNENVQVSKSLILHSTSGDCTNTVVNASDANKHAFNLTADGVHISGFGIENATGAGKAGIFFGSGVTNCSVTNNSVKSNCYGVSLAGASGNNVSCNWVHHNAEAGFYLTGGSTGNAIEQNNIVANGNYNETSGGWEWNVHNAQPDDVKAKNNWWGTNDASIIEASIREDAGTVDFRDYLDTYSPCAPIPELTTVVLVLIGLLAIIGYIRLQGNGVKK